MTGISLRQIAVCFALCAISTVAVAQQRGQERSITRKRTTQPKVAQAIEDHHVDGPIVDGPIVDDPEQFQYEYDYDAHCGLNCSRCGGVGCDLLWARAEYLMFWGQGMRVPPLVTTSPQGTPVAQAGVLGLQSTSILYGGDKILEEMRNGG